MREATIHLSEDELSELGLATFVTAFREAGIRAVRELQCQRPGCLLAVTTETTVESGRLAEIDELAWWERVDAGDGATYLCKIAVPAFEEGLAPYSESEVSPGGVAVGDEGVDVTMVGDHEALADRVADYENAGADVLLRTLTDYDGPDNPLAATTDRQREVLETAFEVGYFEVPREATTEDVAATLDLDPSTVREHLQRAQRNLLGELLGR